MDAGGQLRRDLPVAHDGASDELREQRDVAGEVDEVAGGADVTPPDVDGVAHHLEDVEADA